jgi:hypothetical protein
MSWLYDSDDSNLDALFDSNPNNDDAISKLDPNDNMPLLPKNFYATEKEMFDNIQV